MAVAKILFLWLTCHLILNKADSKCQPSFPCGNFSLEFPFTDVKNPECGLLPVERCDSQYPKVHIEAGQSPRSSLYILQKLSKNSFLMKDIILQALLDNDSCYAFIDMSLIYTPSVSFTFSPNLTVFECLKVTYSELTAEYFEGYGSKECDPSTVYYRNITPAAGEISTPPYGCAAVQLPKSNQESGGLINLVNATFIVEWSVSEACSTCYQAGGQCLNDNQNKFFCEQGTSFIC